MDTGGKQKIRQYQHGGQGSTFLPRVSMVGDVIVLINEAGGLAVILNGLRLLEK